LLIKDDRKSLKVKRFYNQTKYVMIRSNKGVLSVKETFFSNEMILSWIQYFSQNVEINLSKLKILDITGKNKNLLPTIMGNRAVLVFTDAGHPDIFYDMWNAELGECDVWYNEGSEPAGEIKHNKLSDMINRGINASAAMLILNPNAETNMQIGMENSRFSHGSVHYVCREVRAVIMNKLHLKDHNNICIISGESIAVEAAMIASEGSVIAVEYDIRDQQTMEQNVKKFGLTNVVMVNTLNDEVRTKLPIPDMAFIVASQRIDSEIKILLKLNPAMDFVIYTLDFEVMASLTTLLQENGLERTEAIHIEVSRVNSKNMIEQFPAPWIISCRRRD
jgi:precorrin-6Y C5,15-methyltransferase (decarboxylating)